MNREEFRKKIKEELTDFSKEQLIRFAWQCAVRALPFLGSAGNLEFWDKKDRQKHLYAVFYALDNTVVADVGGAAAAASSAASSSSSSSSFAAAASSSASAAASAAAYVAASSSSSSFAASSSAAASSAAAFSASAAGENEINLQHIIWEGLKTVQNNRVEESFKVEWYGEIWINFEKALAAEGCAYWGRLYKKIIEDGRIVDQEALQKRINVPTEIREQGAAVVAAYLEELEKGAKRLNEARIVILGEKGAGKTCIARRLIDPLAPMTTDEESTPGVDTLRWPLEQENINVHIWDFAGHTVTHAVHQFFLSERCLYLIVYDGRTEKRNRLTYWLDHMKNYGGNSQAMILVNERDCHSSEIPINSLKEQYSIAGVATFSIGDDADLLAAFRNEVIRYISDNPSWKKQEIPENYYHVKDELEKLFAKDETQTGREHITKMEFAKIAAKYKINDAEQLLKDLHYLGVSLWYREMEEFDTLVLNPEWISYGVYQIINWVNETKRHAIKLKDFPIIFQENAKRYPADKHKFLYKLMKYYELAYETREGDCLIIPHLLKIDRPEKLPQFSVGESLMLRYHAEQPLPPNSISRFIVRHNQDIKKENGQDLVWRYGVVLDNGQGGTALVREEDRTISVSVTGSDKTNYLSALRKTLNDIFSSYKSQKPKLEYRIEQFGQLSVEMGEKNPLWLSGVKIYNHAEDGVPYYEDRTRQLMDLTPTCNIYNIRAGNLMLGGSENQFLHDQSRHITFNFHDCNIGLQGNLNELAQLLTENGNEEAAKELEGSVKALEQAEGLSKPEELKKKGVTNRLKRLVEDLADEKSKLHKTVKGIKNGIRITQDIAKGYNDIAQWAGLPQVPKPFLK
jgi:C-terminal of Roc, COR, domain/Ras of Complex, Roc, domain of DAPkinase